MEHPQNAPVATFAWLWQMVGFRHTLWSEERRSAALFPAVRHRAA